MADTKTYDFSSTCPMCGCAVTCSLTEEEMKERFDDPQTAKLQCQTCRHRFEIPMQTACLDWDEFCQTEFSRFG